MRRLIARMLQFLRPDKEPSVPGLWILLIPLTLHRKMRRIFYDGPSVYSYPGRRIRGYRSPNLMIGIWLHAVLSMWFTTLGRIFFVLTGAFMFFGLISIQMPAYILAFALFVLFIVDFAVGWFFRPKLDLTREHPSLVESGQLVRLDYTITNNRRFTVWDLLVDILAARHTEVPAGIAEIRSLEPGEEVRVNHEIRFKERGRYDLPVPIASSSFPFGLWRWGSKGRPTPPVHVYPSFSSLESLAFPLGREGRQGHELQAAKASDSNDFMGCREFRYGDSPRLIHAASWARLGVPVIKEFREEYLPHAALLIDNFCPKPTQLQELMHSPNQRLEAVLTVTAAVAEKLTGDNYLVDVFVPGWESTHLKETHGLDQLNSVLELTACIEPNTADTFHGPERDQLSRIEDLQNLLLILLDWDDTRQAFVDVLLERNVGVKTILIHPDANSFTTSEQFVVVSPDDVLSGHIHNL